MRKFGPGVMAATAQMAATESKNMKAFPQV
jgi:hypothetical protein